LSKISQSNQLGVAFLLWLHALPYVISFCLIGRFVIFGLIGLSMEPTTSVLDSFVFHVWGIARGIVEGVVVAITAGIIFGIVFGVARGIVWGTAFGIILGITLGVAPGITLGIALGIALGIIFGIAFGISFWVNRGIAFGITIGIALGFTLGIILQIGLVITSRIIVGIALGATLVIAFTIARSIRRSDFRGIALGSPIGIIGAIVFGMAEGIMFGLIFITLALRLYYYPIHLIFFWPKVRGQWYPYHPVNWDDTCVIPFPKLDRLLIAYAEHEPKAVAKEIERLIVNYPSQRSAALYAKEALLAREAGRVKDLALLDDIVARLPEGRKSLLADTSRLREMIQDISRWQTRLHTADRPMFRELLAQALCKEIENFQHRIAGFHEPLTSEFRKAAKNWLVLAERQLREVQAILAKEPKPQVFRAGDPVKRDQEAFVPRQNVVGELEKQIMLSTGCPGLMLYGRRRMGKSTILHNLSGFLPANVVPVNISMQNPQAFTSINYFVQLLAHAVQKVLPSEKKSSKMPADLPSFFQFLSQCNHRLEQEDKRLLLALDEYENIDVKIGECVFAEDLLATLRESIQTHRRLTWIFAGRHEITELKHAAWTSYLVSARTLEVPIFTPAETRLLLTEPLKYSELWSKDDPKRPRFTPDFWGERGIDRIYQEAGGWPHLVQLLAETIIDLINDEEKRQVDEELFERSLDKAIVSGYNVLYQLMRGESTLPGEWEYLSAFRKRETQPPPDSEVLYVSLQRRLLVEETNNEWRLRVPLMARWLRQRG
jgi:hypothetical protein